MMGMPRKSEITSAAGTVNVLPFAEQLRSAGISTGIPAPPLPPAPALAPLLPPLPPVLAPLLPPAPVPPAPPVPPPGQLDPETHEPLQKV